MVNFGEHHGQVLSDEPGFDSDILDVDRHIVEEVEEILHSKVGSLYLSDVYNIKKHRISIVYPSLVLGGTSGGKLLLSPDRLKFLLSIYPEKQALKKISRIIIRPRYVEVGNIELHSLYHRKKKTLVLYLSSPSGSDFPFGEEVESGENRDFSEANFHGANGVKDISVGDSRGVVPRDFMKDKMIWDSLGNVVKSHGKPMLWSVISALEPRGEGEMEKFLVRHHGGDGKVHGMLGHISQYYGSHGY